MDMGDDFLSRQRVLVIAPHSDDETYGCAGTIARMKTLGSEVYALLVSVGSLDHYGSDREPGMHMVTAHTRLSEFEATAELLKIDDWEVLYPGGAEHMALGHGGQEGHCPADRAGRSAVHRTGAADDVADAVDELQPGPRGRLPRLYDGDAGRAIPLFGIWFPMCCATTTPACSGRPRPERFHPNVFVDVTEFRAIKMEALRTHASQVRGPLFHGSPEATDLAAQVRGREISVGCAEGFVALRMAF